MNYPGWLILNIYTLILAALLLIFQHQDRRSFGNALFVRLVVATMALITMDSISEFYRVLFHAESIFLHKLGSYCVFAFDPLAYLYSILYIDQYVDAKRAKSRNWFLTPMKAFVVLNFILVTVSTVLNLNWFYGYRDGVYFRGPYFLARVIVNVFFCVMVQVYVLRYRRNINQAYRVPLSLFPAIMLTGGLLQVIFEGLSCLYAATMLACLLLFTFVQRMNLNVDYLTGALNRRGIDLAFEHATAQAGVTGYGAAMIDVDYFKQINDRFGHNKGDEALVAIAECLRASFPKPAVVGRYGGDEFFVVYPGADRAAMEGAIADLHGRLDRFNRTKKQPFELQISTGRDIYDAASGMDGSAFRHHVDQLMYAEKQRNHAGRDN